MNVREYYDHSSLLWEEVDARNQEVKKFVAEHPDLLLDGVYEKFWDLQNEATLAVGKVQEFQDNNRHKVTR